MPSAGGWTTVLRLPHTADEIEVCLALLEAGVQVQPGHFYDFPRGRWLVLSLLPPPARFAEGVERLSRTLGATLFGPLTPRRAAEQLPGGPSESLVASASGR